MRRILLADLAATAQLLARWPAADRPALLARLLSQTQAADRFSRRFGRPHADWGNGSLLSRVLQEPRVETPEDHNYWASLSLVAAAIAARHSTIPPLAGCERQTMCYALGITGGAADGRNQTPSVNAGSRLAARL